MKKQLLFITIAFVIGSISLLFEGCSKKEVNTTTLTVYTKCKYKNSFYPFKTDTSTIVGANIYLYKDFNFALDNDHVYIGNGILKNKITGVEMLYWKKEVSTYLSTYFENLPDGTYGVVVDISNLDTENKIDSWIGSSIKLPMNVKGYKYNNAINFVFDIEPYQPWDIGL